MRFFKVNGKSINLDLIKQIYIKLDNRIVDNPSYHIYADDILIVENNTPRQAEINLDILMSKIKSGRKNY